MAEITTIAAQYLLWESEEQVCVCAWILSANLFLESSLFMALIGSVEMHVEPGPPRASDTRPWIAHPGSQESSSHDETAGTGVLAVC
ncbi:unnamed protein product [Arctogadus glacialis]